jgi:hypothetical protein
MAAEKLTPEEIVESLKRSQLPTILVEGREDMSYYRWMELDANIDTVDVLPCGGRDALFSVFERRKEFSHISCVFVADRDLWLFSSIPAIYKEIIFTEGYSIENDVLNGSSVHNLLNSNEIIKFDKIANCLSEWFAFEIEQFRCSKDYKIDIHPNHIVKLGTYEINHDALSPRLFRKPHERLVKSIRKQFKIKIRGKTLLDLYSRILNSPEREAKHSKKAIIEIATKCNDNEHKRRLKYLIRRKVSRKNKNAT